MKQYDFDYPSEYEMGMLEERLLDQMCEKLSTNVKDIVVKTVIDDTYKNFVAELDNGKEIDCEISYDIFNKRWLGTVWEME